MGAGYNALRRSFPFKGKAGMGMGRRVLQLHILIYSPIPTPPIRASRCIEPIPTPALCVSRCIGPITAAFRLSQCIEPIPTPALPLKGRGTNVETNFHGRGTKVKTSIDGREHYLVTALSVTSSPSRVTASRRHVLTRHGP